jgi:hypothetical protein
LAGCAAIPQQKLVIEPAAAGTTITVLPIGIPERAEVTVVHSTGASFGLVGELVDGERFQAHEKTLAAVIERQQFDFHAEIVHAVEAAVRDDGYRVDRPDGAPMSTRRVTWLTPMPDIKDSDYVLDVVFDYFGYAADWDSQPYLPSVAMKARLTDRSGKQLFFTRVYYNPALGIFGKSKGPKIPADVEYAFGSMGDIKANPARAIKGLELAVQSVLGELREELRSEGAPSVAKSD